MRLVTLAKSIRFPGGPLYKPGKQIEVEDSLFDEYVDKGVFVVEGSDEDSDVVAAASAAPVVEEPATVPEPEPTPAAGVERPKMTATVDVWREYAEANGVKTTGLSKKEIIGAMDSIGA